MRAQPSVQLGDSVSVYLFTVGQGDEVWERFGHNAIGIRYGASSPELLYNWGLFDFAAPDFLGRFIRGDMIYWMGASYAFNDVQLYEQRNRDIVIQELNLTARQRDSLVRFLSWNAQPEHKFYHYDYFRDNCSTRVRDALDRVLGGALRRATDSILTRETYRDQALRLMAQEPLLATGIDVGLGRPTDRRITAWEEMFIPMRMRDRLRGIQVPDDSGRAVPLVRSERVIFRANRPAEPEARPHRGLLFFLISALVAAGMVLLSPRSSSRGAPKAVRVLVVVWSIGVGALGCLLAFLWLATRHVYSYDNLNVLQYNPLWLILGILIPFAKKPSATSRVVTLLAVFVAALTALALLLAIVPATRQHSIDVLLLALPANLAAAYATWRLTPAPNRAEAAA